MNYLSRRARLFLFNLKSLQLGDIPQILLKIITHKKISAFCLKSSYNSAVHFQFKTSKYSLSSKSSSEIYYISKTSNNMPSKKRITRVRFNDASRTSNQQTSSQITARPASQRSISPGNTRTARQRSNSPGNTRNASQRPSSINNTRAGSPLQTATPTSPAHSSNVSIPLTPSPHVPTFDYTVSKIFKKYLISSLTSKDAVLKEVRDCIQTNNESRLKTLNPYIHSYGTDLHVRSGCVCIDEKVAIPNVL